MRRWSISSRTTFLLLMVCCWATGGAPGYAADPSERASGQQRVPPASDAAVSSMIGVQVDPRLPSYDPAEEPILEAIQIVGDVATLTLAEKLAAALRARHPALLVRTRSINAALTPPWWNVSSQPTTVALFNKPMSETAKTTFVQQLGYPPLRLRIAMNAIVVVVHPSNPLTNRGLTIPALDAIFSLTRRQGHAAVHTWADLGLEGRWRQKPIAAHGLDASTDLFVLFGRQVLKRGILKETVSRHPSSEAVLRAVADSTAGIGYAGRHVVDERIGIVPVAEDADKPFVAPTPEAILRQQYPLSHFVYLYLNREPESNLEKHHRAVVRFIYSQQGQELLASNHYVPLPASVVDDELQSLALTTRRP